MLRNPRNDIVATVLLPLDGSVFVNSPFSSQAIPGYAFSEQPWYKQAVDLNGQVAFISVHSQDYFPAVERKQVFSVARLIKDPDSWKPLGVIMADADTNVLRKITSDLKLNVTSTICILDGNNQLLFSSKPLSDKLLTQIPQQTGLLEDASDSYVRVSKTIKPSQWKVVVLLSNSEISAQVRWLYLVGFLFAFGGLALTFIMFYKLSEWIVNPFQEMIVVMKKVQRGDLRSRFMSRGKDEIAELGDALNTMVDQLGELIDREYKAVLSQRNAEYLALQSQIQPHFLYNTLNSFIALNRAGERPALEKSIYALSSMLRYTLSQDDWATLGEEFLFLQRYCDLQSIRFQERLTVNVSYPQELSEFRLPKLLLQPLVENAIIHGVEPVTKLCTVTVRAECVHDTVKIVVIDDGAGFNVQGETAKEAIGLANVRERLKRVYPTSVFSIRSDIEAGTEITIEIPELALAQEPINASTYS
jgi:two-component system sensor histidine kinase YesM